MAKRLPQEFKQRLRHVEERLSTFEHNANRISLYMEDFVRRLSASRLYAILERSIKHVAPVVRKALMLNYNLCGLGSSPRNQEPNRGNAQPHGWIKKLINQTSVTLKVRVSTLDRALVPYIIVTLGGGSATEAQYEAAASLNWGAVHLHQELRMPYNPALKHIVPLGYHAAAGESAKRSIKKLALVGRVSKKALRALQRGAFFHGIQTTHGFGSNIQQGARFTQSKEHANTTSGPRAIFVGADRKNPIGWTQIPFPFFYFTPRQLQDFSEALNSYLIQEVSHAS